MLGVPEEKFWDSTSAELEPYRKMHEMRLEVLDYQMYQMGIYVQSAVHTAVSACLAGSKSRAKYIEKPLSQLAKEEQEDPQRDFNQFVAWTAVFNENFKAKHGQG